MSLWFFVVAGALLVAVMLVVFLGVAASQRNRVKSKRDKRVDPVLGAMAASGRLTLEDDGELPEWVDSLAEKPKRHTDD